MHGDEGWDGIERGADAGVIEIEGVIKSFSVPTLMFIHWTVLLEAL
jgi:hypothetical protein